MYNIDINFLRDRKLDSTSRTTVVKRARVTPMSEKLPIFIGAGVGVALIAASGGALLFLNSQKASTEREIAELEAEINRLQGQNQDVQRIQGEINAVEEEIGALVSVLNNIKPWSALLVEIGQVVPPNIQIQSIAQSDEDTILINGIADSYEDINDFALTLKNSQFLDSETTRIISSSKIDHPSTVQLSEAGDSQANNLPLSDNLPTVELPQVISYSIETNLSDIPASQLVSVLRNRGAIGLVSRIKTLEQKGAIKP